MCDGERILRTLCALLPNLGPIDSEVVLTPLEQADTLHDGCGGGLVGGSCLPNPSLGQLCRSDC
jgi:hypothetical protein